MAEIQVTGHPLQLIAHDFTGQYSGVYKGLAYMVTVTPEYGRPVTLYVRPNPHSRNDGHIVTRRTWGDGYISRHTTLAAAIGAANRRANKYLKQHSKPFGTQVAKAGT